MNKELNLPHVVAELESLHVQYEAALVAKDLDALSGYFVDNDAVIRFGIADVERGAAALAAFRAAQPPPPPGRTLFETEVAAYGEDVAVVTTLFRYPGRTKVGRQSQTWVRLDEGWRIVHAHVSEIPEEPAVIPG